MTQTDEIFNLDDKTKEKLQLTTKFQRNMTSEILEIFKTVKKRLGKTELSVDEITAAYYNMFTRNFGTPLRNKKAIIMKLFLMKGGKDGKNGELEAVEGKKGVYRLRSVNLNPDNQ
jgi:hypothetical protein